MKGGLVGGDRLSTIVDIDARPASGMFLHLIELGISLTDKRVYHGRPRSEHLAIVEYTIVSFRL